MTSPPQPPAGYHDMWEQPPPERRAGGALMIGLRAALPRFDESDGERIAARMAYVFITLAMASVAAMSWSGEYGFARNTMRWPVAPSALVPVSLDIAAIAAALRALTLIRKGESAVQHRLIAFTLVGLGAFVNWRHALISGNVAEEVFFPTMSVVAYWLVHAEMSAWRREDRRSQHGHGAKRRVAPLPRTGLLPWVPGIGEPRQALALLRGGVHERLEASKAAAGERPRPVRASVSRRALSPESRDESQRASDSAAATASDRLRLIPGASERVPASDRLAGMNQTEAIRAAVEAVGADVPAVRAWLADRGRPVVSARVCDVIKRYGLKQEAL